MKSIIITIGKVMILTVIFSLSLQGVMAQASKKEAKSVAKEAKKEAKKLTKAGWVVPPGQLPIESQLNKAYLMRYDRDDKGMEKYIFGNAQSIAGNLDAGKMQATELARLDLAGKLGAQINQLIESSLANAQLEPDEAVSITETVAESTTAISATLKRIETITEMYRELPNKNREVQIGLAYNTQMALDEAKETVKKNLEKRGSELRSKLDQALGF